VRLHKDEFVFYLFINSLRKSFLYFFNIYIPWFCSVSRTD
jgi:hypothetical protein